MKAALIFKNLSKETAFAYQLENGGSENYTFEEIKLNYSGFGVITRHTGVCIDITYA